MAWLPFAVAIVLALGLAAATPFLLQRLPTPPDEPDARPYRELASPRFRWLVGLGTLAALAVALPCTNPWSWGPWVALSTGGVLLAVIDAHTGFLPRVLTLTTWATAGCGVVVAALAGGDAGIAVSAIAGTLGAGGMFWALWRIGAGMGFGDVRLAGLIGTVTGATSLRLTGWSLLIGGLVGVAWGLATRVRRGSDGPFPYGPSLVIGPFLALVASAGLAA